MANSTQPNITRNTVYIADFSYYPVSIITCILFLINYKLIGPLISNFISKSYKNLPYAKRCDWNTRVNSTLHASLVTFGCIYIMIYDDATNLDPVWGESAFMRCICAVVVGYMISDILIVLYHWKEIGEVFFIFHHAASIYAYLFVMTYSVLPWFANFRLLAEFSTPLINMRWFLAVLKFEKTNILVVVNGVAMTLAFFLVRIAVLPIYWGMVYTYYGTASAQRIGRMWIVLITSCIVLDSINIYWMYKIIKGMTKVLKSKPIVNEKPKEQ